MLQQNDSDDEQCALSDKWQYERKSRRWSRVVEITPQAQRRLQVIIIIIKNAPYSHTEYLCYEIPYYKYLHTMSTRTRKFTTLNQEAKQKLHLAPTTLIVTTYYYDGFDSIRCISLLIIIIMHTLNRAPH